MSEKKDKKIDRTAILLEDLHSKFNVFGENLVCVMKDVSTLKEDVSGLKEDNVSLKAGQDALFEIVGKSVVDIEEIKKEIKEIKKVLSGALTREEGRKIEKRVFVLEQKVGLA